MKIPQISLAEASARVVKTEINSDDSFRWEPNLLMQEIGWSLDIDLEAWSKRVTAYFIEKWLCTDTMVGMSIVFIDDEPIAMSWKPARKSRRETHFFGLASVERLRQLALELQDLNGTTIPSIIDPKTELVDAYASVRYVEQFVSRKAFVIRDDALKEIEIKNDNSRDNLIYDSDGNRVSIDDVLFPLILTGDPVPQLEE